MVLEDRCTPILYCGVLWSLKLSTKPDPMLCDDWLRVLRPEQSAVLWYIVGIPSPPVSAENLAGVPFHLCLPSGLLPSPSEMYEC